MRASGTIAIIGAMDEEIAHFKDILSSAVIERWHEFEFTHGQLHSHSVVVSKSGVGKVLSAAHTQHLIDKYKPSVILFSGLAGALNPELEIGDIIVGSQCVQHDMDASALGFSLGQIPYTSHRFVSAPPNLVELALKFRHPHGKIVSGIILSGDQFITGEKQSYLKRICGELGGDAIEMEGAAVALISELNKVPCLIMRTISDRADHSAKVDFGKFLPEASRNASLLLEHMLERL